jgi:hypothetical protein
MPRRRSAVVLRLVYGGEPVPCAICEGKGHRYGLSLWPVTWTAQCLSCGITTACGAAPARQPVRKSPEPRWRTTDSGWLPPD